MKTTTSLAAATAVFAFASADAAIIQMDLLGKAGFGLLPGNETGSVAGTPGSGGEIGTGILFNDVTLSLAINVAWGTANGFTNLTGNATMGHIHGPTPSPAPASFNEAVGVLIGLDNLTGWNSSASSGGFNGSVTLTPSQASDLMAGRLYINVHTTINSPGEIRGNIVPVPEPSFPGLLAAGTALLALRRRRS